jgi:phosphopantothenoylcysteine decarboxylase/phosphopantothenate--cysteine ligase
MNFLVTAGPTREPIDPVRFISNRSSGKMGYEVARAALERGHAVRLISGPVALPPPPGAEVIPVITAQDMCEAVQAHLASCDVLVMVAAVADWRPVSKAPRKIKKAEAAPVLHLERTPDILETVRPAKGARLFVGFAAETDRLLDEARRKLVQKGLDLIVANDVLDPQAGFEVDTNKVTLISADGHVEPLTVLSKTEVARRLVQWIESRRSR